MEKVGKKEGELHKIEYFENKKSFPGKLRIIFHNFFLLVKCKPKEEITFKEYVGTTVTVVYL